MGLLRELTTGIPVLVYLTKGFRKRSPIHQFVDGRLTFLRERRRCGRRWEFS